MAHRWSAEEAFVSATAQLVVGDGDDASTSSRVRNALELLEFVRFGIKLLNSLQVVGAIEPADRDY
jgi:hypothetical protein